ncbi:MAG: hypothetical protein ACPGQS_01910 [Bradymonadia bacterium]
MKPTFIVNLALALCLLALGGCEGKQGAAGVAGAQGRQGETGATGANGADGMNGATGADGADGRDGVDGMDGADGQDGRDGADAVCASAARLNLDGLTGLPEEIIEGTTVASVAVESNAEPSRPLRLSFSGNLPGVSFVDNGDNTFAIVAAAGSATDVSALFSLVATDGCTTDTLTFTINGIAQGSAVVTFVHAVPGVVADVWVLKGEQVVGRLADGAAEMTLNGALLQPGQYTFAAYVSNAVAMSPADYDEGALIGTTEVIDVEVRGNSTLFVYPDVDGNPTFNYVVNDVSPTADETFFSANVAHFASAAGQVDILNLDAGMPLLEDVDFGSVSGRVELPSGTYNLGIDVDNDGEADLIFDPVEAPAGANTTIFATVVDGAVVLGVLVLDLETLNLAIVNQFVPPLSNDGANVASFEGEIIPTFPFPSDGFISYANDQSPVDGTGIQTMTVPGATRMQITVSYDVETGYDQFVALDASGMVLVEYTGQGQATIAVDGDSVVFGVDSDEFVCTGQPDIFGVDPQGYQILGITYE